MTPRANSLTKRATERTEAPAYRWSMPASDVRAFMHAFGQLGFDRDELLSIAGIEAAGLADPDARIPCEALGQIIAAAERERFTPNIALRLAQVTPVGANPLLDYLVLTSDTVGAGARQLATYFRLVGNPVVLTVREDIDPVRLEMAGTAAPFSIEYTSALVVLRFRAETGGRFRADGVNFAHEPDDAREYERVLGCPVRSAASWNGIGVSAAIWQLPLTRRDPVLRGVLEDRAADVLARLPTRAGLALEVQRALTEAVTAGGSQRIDEVARRLGMSGRTLQRRLAAEAVSYQALLDEARKEAAGRYLGESQLAICEVAYLVGYSEPAPFHRAFKRWHGMTPEAFRHGSRRG